MPNIVRDAFMLLVWAYLSLRYTTSVMPLWMMVLAHSLQGNKPTYIYKQSTLHITFTQANNVKRGLSFAI